MAAVIVGEERYVFDCEWYDQQAELIRYYRITFYPTDQTIEMVSQTFEHPKDHILTLNYHKTYTY